MFYTYEKTLTVDNTGLLVEYMYAIVICCVITLVLAVIIVAEPPLNFGVYVV